MASLFDLLDKAKEDPAAAGAFLSLVAPAVADPAPVASMPRMGMIGGVRGGGQYWQGFNSDGLAHAANPDYQDYSQLFREYTFEAKPGYVPVGKRDGRAVYAAPDYARDEAGNYLPVSASSYWQMANERGALVPTRDEVQALYGQATQIPMPTYPNGKGPSDGYTARVMQQMNGVTGPIAHGKEFFAVDGPVPAGRPAQSGGGQTDPRRQGSTIGGVAGRLVSGLVARGMPEHVAQGFVMNFASESGLNSSINEAKPIVPGSRGGYGLAQWTGPRRRALEAYAAERGKPVYDVDLQLDFLMQELNGSESAAYRKILATDDARTAAVAVLNNFERPAEQHRARREAEYLRGAADLGELEMAYEQSAGNPTGQGGGGLLDMVMSSKSPDMGDRKETGSGLNMPRTESDGLFGTNWLTRDRIDRLIIALQAMTLNPNPAVIAAAQDRIRQRGEKRDAAEAMNKTVSYFANMEGGQKYADIARAFGGAAAFSAWQSDQQQATPAQYRQVTGEEAAAMGLDPSQAYNVGPDGKVTGIGAGDTNINIPGQPMIGTIPPGYQAVQGDDGAFRFEPIPGGPVEAEAAGLAEKKTEQQRQSDIKMGPTLESLQLNIDEIENGGVPVTGLLGAIGSWVPGTAAKDFEARNKKITTEAALNEIQNMRNNSPTGGAVGQLTDAEREAIAMAATGMDQATSAGEYLRAAKLFRETALNIAYGEGYWELLPNGQVKLKQPAGGGGQPGNILRFDENGNLMQ